MTWPAAHRLRSGSPQEHVGAPQGFYRKVVEGDFQGQLGCEDQYTLSDMIQERKVWAIYAACGNACSRGKDTSESHSTTPEMQGHPARPTERAGGEQPPTPGRASLQPWRSPKESSYTAPTLRPTGLWISRTEVLPRHQHGAERCSSRASAALTGRNGLVAAPPGCVLSPAWGSSQWLSWGR